MAQLKDTTVSGDLTVSGKFNYVDNSIFRVTHDVCASLLNITLVPQSSSPRFRQIQKWMSTIIESTYNNVPTNILLTYYNSSGELQSEPLAITSSEGVVGSNESFNAWADTSRGPIRLTAQSQEDNTKTHVYQITVVII